MGETPCARSGTGGVLLGTLVLLMQAATVETAGGAGASLRGGRSLLAGESLVHCFEPESGALRDTGNHHEGQFSVLH